MCLVVLGWQQHPDFPLIVAGNRDEFHSRPTKEAHWWPDNPDIVGGRDLQASGTWLALHRNGRFATVTNYRDAEPPRAKVRSRGHLVTDFLLSALDPVDYLDSVDGSEYAGFNLIVSDGSSVAWRSNRGGETRELLPGVYGLSNALLNSPWHKVEYSTTALKRLIKTDAVNASELLRLLADRSRAPVSEIESDRLPFNKAHSISAPFIVLPDYGTRSSSIALMDATGGWRFLERRYDADGKSTGETALSFAAGSQE
jgi:uncharacterized protein with NRDE domain